MNEMQKTDERLVLIGQSLFTQLVEATKNPHEAAVILTYMHVCLWVNGREPLMNLEEVLRQHCDAVRFNVNEHDLGQAQ